MRDQLKDDFVEAGEALANASAARSRALARITDLLPAAVEAGVPVALVAQLTGLSRVTIYGLLKKVGL